MTRVVRVMSYNIRYGGVGKETELATVIQAVAPDIVLLQEATHPHVIARLADTAGYPHYGSRRGQSTGFMSRLPVASHAWHLPRGARHPFLEVAVVEPEMRLFGLHLSAWFSKWSERRRHFEIRALLEGIKEHQHGFHLLLGDFNALAPGEVLDVVHFPQWIRAMVWLSGRDIARDTIQTMLDANYADVWRRFNADDPGYTFPTWNPHLRLDYAFVPMKYAERVKSFEIVQAPPIVKTASDHHPILVTLD
ncbi:MAG TPA: endonuclease/exonuclease/phosphatase family protein [Gemmatimonadaceae bacterium]|nr:endonuclease/exonuclease/phosphatase family protein [Gemmatimonadaceae bacterium]